MFTASELDGMTDAQEEHMMDECILRVYTGSQDTYGEINATYADGITIKCGLEMKGGEIRSAADKTVIFYDAKIRLPKTFSFSLHDRIKITKRFNTAITPIEYAIISTHSIGPSGMRLLLQKVAT